MVRQLRGWIAAWAGLAVMGGAAARAEFAAPVVVMSGLLNPRGMAFGPDGSLYVAEAGAGGNGPSIPGGEGPVSLGATGGVSRLRNGVQERVVSGLPSLATTAVPNQGTNATGLHDIAFDSQGRAYGVTGLGAPPAERANLGAGGAALGSLVRLPIGGGAGLEVVADLAAFEAENNPAGGPLDTNPYSLVALPGGGFAVADAGGNSLLRVTEGGAISTLTTFPPKPNPVPPPPTYEAVPTSVALGPDGAIFVGQLTGFPFPVGGAEVFRFDPTSGARTVAASGFTNIVDLAFGPDGSLYVLQLTTNGLASPTGPGPGALIRVDLATGARETILSEGLTFPGGLAIDRDGSIYVSNLGVSPGGGQVLYLQAVPEPGSIALLGLGLTSLGVLEARRRRKATAPASV